MMMHEQANFKLGVSWNSVELKPQFTEGCKQNFAIFSAFLVLFEYISVEVFQIKFR